MRGAVDVPATHKGRFMVGRDGKGHWIVSDSMGLSGGIFADRETAVHFAMVECGYAPGEVCAAPAEMVLSVDAIFAADRLRKAG